MNVFEFRKRVIEDYERFSRSFSKIKAEDIAHFVDAEYRAEKFWPAPLVQLNPNFVAGSSIEDLVHAGLLHEECRKIFRVGKTPGDAGKAMRLHKHQEDAIRTAHKDESYVLTTGTGSGKSLAYFIPIIHDILRRRSQGDPCKGISAIVIYPMNALCNSQLEELEKFLTMATPTVSPLMIPLVYCHIKSFQRASSVGKPWPGGENRIDGRAAHHEAW